MTYNQVKEFFRWVILVGFPVGVWIFILYTITNAK